MKTKKLKINNLINCYKAMYSMQEIEKIEENLVKNGKSSFFASSAGHEGIAIFNELLIKEDWLHCHYRDKALLHARGIKPEIFFYNSLNAKEGSSNGRQMVIGISSKKHNIVSIVTPVGNQAIPAVGIATSIKEHYKNPIVYCSMGDGATQQGEVLESMAEAKRHCLPILFVIENNGLAISTKTKGKTFYSLPNNKIANSFYDIKINYIDGTKPLENVDIIYNIISNIRKTKIPQIIIFNIERIKSHSNADDHNTYRSQKELKSLYDKDPITLSRNYLLNINIQESILFDIENKCKQAITLAYKIAINTYTIPTPCFETLPPIPKHLTKEYGIEYRGNLSDKKRISMKHAIRKVFHYRLSNDNNIYILGQDIEDNKGDIFGITKGLSTQFPGRIVNSPLSESTIIGICTGMALTGKKPVAFIQFADFMTTGYNQIFNEISTIYWRSNGEWNCPVIIFASCGGYKAGLGPFHAQTNEGIFCHIPGLDIYMPSNAPDAAGSLNTAFESNRPSIFLYPKALLNKVSLYETTSKDVYKQKILISQARIIRSGNDITMVGWGNTINICEKVAKTLDNIGIETEIIDLRIIKPYDLQTILKSAEKTRNLIVTHEDNITCGMGGEIIAAVIENTKHAIKVKRIARNDTHIPCNFENQTTILPSYENILHAATGLLNISLSWKNIDINYNPNTNYYDIKAIGNNPSDSMILITEIYVKIGDNIKTDNKLVEIESSKSSSTILSPISGIVYKIHATISSYIEVGKNLITLKIKNHEPIKTKIIKEPILKINKCKKINLNKKNTTYTVGISVPCFNTGSLVIENKDLLNYFPQYSNNDIITRTGIEKRFWINDKKENIIEIATKSAYKSLIQGSLKLNDIDMIICSTCTPDKYISPSMSCLILNKLYNIYGKHHIPAFDINAACSGYLYGLHIAHNYIKNQPDKRILLITAEYMTKYLDKKDFNTAFLFGDAATSTIISGQNCINDKVIAKINTISLTSIADNGSTLNIPNSNHKYIQLQGKKIFNFAVKTMSIILQKCCIQNNITLEDINIIIPHQANERISKAIEKQLKIRPNTLYNNINKYGNTSSCSIPIALHEIIMHTKETKNKKVAMCAFGAGFTAAAGLITLK